MITDYHIIEHKKAECREKIRFHTQNVILQSIISLMCIVGGTYAGQKKSIWVQLVLAPTAVESVSRLTKHESKRRQYKKTLTELEKE